YAGIRTFDSVVRSKEVFGIDSITIISQRFHNQRALYIARNKGIAAIAFNAKDVDAYDGFRTRVREYFARVKVIIDIWFNAQPRHLGPKVVIGR
ncbi:MAG TPA: ElyC/SanA/YdcF family protein, partial [Williamwhitmania sp.]|nr:ElyC/SanA/YdcF family protein [Williamwhitmania sp.]